MTQGGGARDPPAAPDRRSPCKPPRWALMAYTLQGKVKEGALVSVQPGRHQFGRVRAPRSAAGPIASRLTKQTRELLACPPGCRAPGRGAWRGAPQRAGPLKTYASRPTNWTGAWSARPAGYGTAGASSAAACTRPQRAHSVLGRPARLPLNAAGVLTPAWQAMQMQLEATGTIARKHTSRHGRTTRTAPRSLGCS